ncbi:UNVERIFIED_CONTAM: hypothetical protein PYX00_004991 [Menopon gallinae]|uniref:Elongation of very long chain fatty acids protein n=1 Tax=Menopon gallinae TaxID=328185 RepID=A0AAW2I6V8_9NEOP
MTSLLSSLQNGYNYIFEDAADPRTNNWFLIRSPIPAFLMLVAYHRFVYSIGPAWMQNRKPFNVDKIIQVYNIIQVLICTWIVVDLFINVYGPTGAYGLKCIGFDHGTSPLAMKLAGFGWVYFMMKVLDLMDTIFFVLRKKWSQITFLHVYHHIGMVFLSWFGTKYLPGGQGIFLVFINSFVHSFMYGYYFITNYNTNYRKNLWWKKYLTQLQLFQFFLIFIQFGRVLFERDCDYPVWPVAVFLPQNFVMIYLFSQFYKKAYLTPQKETNKQK